MKISKMFAFYADYESAEKLKFLLFNPNTILEGWDGGLSVSVSDLIKVKNFLQRTVPAGTKYL